MKYSFQVARSLKDVPKLPGVYAFFVGTQCMYVGESINIQKRLWGHERKHQFPGYEIHFNVCKNHKVIERQLIRELKPLHNGVRPHEPIPRQAEWIANTTVDERLEFTWRMLFGEEPFWLKYAQEEKKCP